MGAISSTTSSSFDGKISKIAHDNRELYIITQDSECLDFAMAFDSFYSIRLSLFHG